MWHHYPLFLHFGMYIHMVVLLAALSNNTVNEASPFKKNFFLRVWGAGGGQWWPWLLDPQMARIWPMVSPCATRRSLSSHRPAAASGSWAWAEGSQRKQLLKYIPPRPSSSGATAQYTLVAAPCCCGKTNRTHTWTQQRKHTKWTCCLSCTYIYIHIFIYLCLYWVSMGPLRTRTSWWMKLFMCKVNPNIHAKNFGNLIAVFVITPEVINTLCIFFTWD